MDKRTLLGLPVICVLLSALVYGFFSSSVTIRSVGSVQSININVFTDIDCTIPCTQVDWGTIDFGKSKLHTLYFKNDGSVTIFLNVTTNNWIPEKLPQHSIFAWNRENWVLYPEQDTPGTLTLTIFASILPLEDPSFSFDITFRGIEYQ